VVKLLRVLFFHAFQAEAELLSSYLRSTTSVDITPISPHCRPEHESDYEHIDAVLVSRVSLRRWWQFEDSLERQFEVPRIILSSWPNEWTRKNLDDAGIDGWMHLNLSISPWSLMDRVSACVRSAPTRGTRRPRTCRLPSDLPLPSDITRGDELNTNILTLLAFGLSDRDIGSSLCLAPHTIRNRVSRMLQASGFESRSALALYFLRAHRLELQARHMCNDVLTA
jgi:hypothetical protein